MGQYVGNQNRKTRFFPKQTNWKLDLSRKNIRPVYETVPEHYEVILTKVWQQNMRQSPLTIVSFKSQVAICLKFDISFRILNCYYFLSAFFYPYTEAVYFILSQGPVKKYHRHVTQVGFEPTTLAILVQCLTNYTTDIAQQLEAVGFLCFGRGYGNDIRDVKFATGIKNLFILVLGCLGRVVKSTFDRVQVLVVK